MENKPVLETNVVKPSLSFFENETEYRLVEFVTEIQLDSKIQEIENFIKNNHGRGESEEVKDKLYGDAKALWEEYAEILRNVHFKFYLNRKQYQFLVELLRDKMEYDVNTVFFAIELTDTMANMKDAKYTDDKGLNSFEVNATEITYIYHLISKHKVKGLSKDAYTFSQILYRIGGISKMINYYEAAHKNLSTEVQNWVLTFEDGVEMEAPAKKAKKEKAVTE